MINSRLCLLASLMLAWIAGGAQAATAIGSVTRLQGAVKGTVDGASKNLASGAAVLADELIATGPAARLEITLTDETVLTLGENATLTLDAFVFKPGATDTSTSPSPAPSALYPGNLRLLPPLAMQA
jgi:hypothetical protein